MITKTDYKVKVPTDELHKMRYWIGESLEFLKGVDGTYRNEVAYNLAQIRDSITCKITGNIEIKKETK